MRPVEWTFLALTLVFAALVGPAATQAQITGTTTRLTTDPANHFGPAISGNFVCYTELQGSEDVYCYDRAKGTNFQVTTATGVTQQILGGVSGNTVVYTETGAASTVKVCLLDPTTDTCIAGSPYAISDGAASVPSIDGSLVAWQDSSSGNLEIWAEDLSTGAKAQITNSPGNPSTNPNVSGRNIVYSTSLGAVCQVFVTDFDTLATTQITTSASGCNSLPDIYGNYVVYQANRDGDQDIYVYDLSTSVETRIALAGLQQNAHVSGDWVSFESLSTTNISSILLYQISTGEVFQAVQATTASQSATLNDIDGLNLVFNSSAAGQLDIYLFQFTVPQVPLTITANNASRPYGAYADPPFTVSYSSNGAPITPDPTQISSTLVCTSADTPSSAAGASYPITCSGLTSSYYAITYVPGILSITQAPLTVTANNAARPYGANNPTFTGTIVGLQNGDSYPVIFNTIATPSSPVGNYPIVPAVGQTSNSIQNYAITIINGTLTVFQEPTSLTVTLAPTSIMVGLSSTATLTLTAPDMVIPIDPSVLAPLTLTSPVLSDILTNGGTCTPVPAATPGLAGCTIGITSVEPNGRTLNAAFAGTTDLGPSTGSADLIVTASLLSQQSCISSDFRNVAVPGGSYIWFNSIFRVRDVSKQLINLSFYQSSVQFQYTDPSGNVVSVNQPLPDAHIVIDPNATTASTSFDPVNNVWLTTIPWDLDDNSFLTGLPWLVPSAGLPADVEPVTMCGTFASDVADIDIGWRWAAAAYSSFSSDNTTLGVKPMDTDFDNPGTNRDLAGTPENYKQFVIPGARGKGGKNYTGSYSRSAIIE